MSICQTQMHIPTEITRKLLSDRYDDVIKALQGTQSFILTESDALDVGHHIAAGSSQSTLPNTIEFITVLSRNTQQTRLIQGGRGLGLGAKIYSMNAQVLFDTRNVATL
jgi:hypothetical protein